MNLQRHDGFSSDMTLYCTQGKLSYITRTFSILCSLLTDAYRPSHWDRFGWSSWQEDASLLSVWTQRHNSEQVRVGKRAAQDERQPYDIPVSNSDQDKAVYA